VRVGEDISERLLELGVGVFVFVRKFPRDATWRHVSSQLVRSTTSSGANYEEARRAESRSDFIHKVSIAAKELGETVYWLRLSARLHGRTDEAKALIDETNELVAILVASARTARAKL
jgi:four helix bundle protein